MTKQDFIKKVKSLNPNIEVLEEYRSMHHPVHVICAECGYGKTFEWKPMPATLLKENACPVCAGKSINRLVPGINDLETWCKKNNRIDVLDDWDYEANAADAKVPNLPSEIARSNPKIKVHWKCAVCGHTWPQTTNKRTTIDKKTHNTAQCPHCSKGGTSFSEQALFYYLSKAFIDLEYRDKTIIGKELDFYIPSKKAAIEFDGFQYHKDKLDKDNEKDQLCHDAGIRIYRIRDKKLNATNYAKVFVSYGIQDDKAFEAAIHDLLIDLGTVTSPDIDIKRDYGAIIPGFKRKVVNNNLSITHPHLATEWHPTLNGVLKPENFTAGEAFPAWWKCSVCGREWPAVIYSRTGGEHNCPDCGLKKQGQSYRQLRASLMSFKTWCMDNNRSDLLEEWDYEANLLDESCPNTPEECPYGSPRPVHWVCRKCGHKWPAAPVYRREGKYKCEKCNNTKFFPGYNDLKTWCKSNNRADLLEDWDYQKNSHDKDCPDTPEEIIFNSSAPIHWKCAKCGYDDWKVPLKNRTILNRGCKQCAHRNKSTKRKTVQCVETGKIYESISEAERAMGGKQNSRMISRSCREDGITAYGYHWRFFL